MTTYKIIHYTAKESSSINAVETEILNEVLLMMDIKQYNIYINNYNIRGMYERRKNHLVAKFFDGNILKYSTTMAKIFDEFQTTCQEQEAKTINSEMYFLMKDIRSKRKYKKPHSLEVSRFNNLSDKLNNLNQGIELLNKMFKSSQKLKT